MFSNPFKKKKKERPPEEDIPGPPPAPRSRPQGRSQGGPQGPAPSGGQGGVAIPTNEVKALSSRGVPEPDIIRTLKREGYSINEIDQAMKDALRGRVSGDSAGPAGPGAQGPGGPPPIPSREQMPKELSYPTSQKLEEPDFDSSPLNRMKEQQQAPRDSGLPRGGDFMRRPSPPPRERDDQQRSRRKGSSMEKDEIEELAEIIVNEKLRGLKSKFSMMDTRFEELNKRIESIANEINSMKTKKSSDVKSIEEKIDVYSKNMGEIGGRMESVEKVLKDSLGPMLESMRSLSELVKSMKEKEGK